MCRLPEKSWYVPPELVILAVLSSLFFVVLARVIPDFTDMYVEMGSGSSGMRLPTITRALLAIPFAVWPLLAVASAGFFVFLGSKWRKIPLSWQDMIPTLVIVVGLAASYLVVIALFSPLIGCREALPP